MGHAEVGEQLAIDHAPLTAREAQVLELVAEGFRNQDVAASLHISIKTVEFHLSNIRGKLRARSRTEAVVHAWRLGLLDLAQDPLPVAVG